MKLVELILLPHLEITFVFGFSHFFPPRREHLCLKKLGTLKDLDISRTVSDSNDLEEPVSLNGLETFSLSYKVCCYCLGAFLFFSSFFNLIIYL